MAMRVLLLAPSLPDLERQERDLHTRQLFRYLAREHEVYLLTFSRGPHQARLRFALEGLCRKVEVVPLPPTALARNATTLVSRLALGAAPVLRRESYRAMRGAVRRVLASERIDAVHVSQLRMAPFVPAAWKGPLILDERLATWRDLQRLADGTSVPVRRWLLRRAMRTLREAEASTCRRATITLAASERERQALEQAIGTSWAIHIVPPALDLAAWEPVVQARRPDPRRLLTIGAGRGLADGADLAWFLRTAYPAIRQALPDATYDIAGTSSRLAQWRLERRPGVRAHRLEAAPGLWEQAGIFIAPSRTTGMQAEILQALAAGVPVVTTPAACDGLAVAHDEHVLVASTPDEFAASVARLATDTILTRLLVLRGRRLVEDRYDSAVALAGLNAAYEHVLAGAPRCVLCS
jgi:glycosyltransferase involved in cell wall biosynthesis